MIWHMYYTHCCCVQCAVASFLAIGYGMPWIMAIGYWQLAVGSGETPGFLAHPASPPRLAGGKALGELEANPQLNCC
jgi:hypothetical protein